LPSLLHPFNDVDGSNSGNDNRDDHCKLMMISIKLQVVILTYMPIEVLSRTEIDVVFTMSIVN
jgi:hypothetical protein